MGRKPKCTVEEKISAVEDYLNGIRSVSEIFCSCTKNLCQNEKSVWHPDYL